MAKTRVIKETCIGCGVCVSIADAVFAFGSDGLAENILGDETELPTDLVLVLKKQLFVLLKQSKLLARELP